MQDWKEYRTHVAKNLVDETWIKIRDSVKASTEDKIGNLETHRDEAWFNQECSQLANERKQTQLLYL